MPQTQNISTGEVLSPAAGDSNSPVWFGPMCAAAITAQMDIEAIRRFAEVCRLKNLQMIASQATVVDCLWHIAEILRRMRSLEAERFVVQLDQCRAVGFGLLTDLCAYEVFVADWLSGPHQWKAPAIVEGKRRPPGRELATILNSPPKSLTNVLRKMIKITEVLAYIPYSRTQLYELIAAGTFPKPVHFGGHASFWVEDEVAAWITTHIDAERPMVDPLPSGTVRRGKKRKAV
jgi:prophage regulatory protein